MSKVATFDGAPPAGTINLGIGQPSADLLPVDLVRQASESFFRVAVPFEFNYGQIAGDPRFLESLANYLTVSYQSPTSPDSLFLTAGNSQAMDMASSVFANPGDTVFVEEPSYFLAFKIFRDHGLKVVGIPVDADGLCPRALEQALEHHRPAFLYTIPSFHNPGGQSTTAARRKRIVELALEHGFLVLADEVYQLLYYQQQPPPAYATLTDSGVVVSMGSFSKILAPALRLGWVQTAPKLRQKLLGSGFVNSGGSVNHISSHIVRHAIDDGLLAAHLEQLRRAYRCRVAAMDGALTEYFSDIARWTTPLGGYFFWLRFADDVDTGSLREAARERQTGFQAGRVFSSSGQLNNYLRLSFAHYSEAEIRTGIERLANLF